MKKVIYIVSLILTVFLFNNCKSTKESTNQNTESATIVISYYQTPGFSPAAPEYTIEVYNNKQMFLIAKKGLDVEGRYMRTLSKEEYNQLITSFDNSSFFEFKDEYTNNITDLPTRFISYTKEGKTKKVKDYYGAPESLKELELILQSYLDRAGWTKMTW